MNPSLDVAVVAVIAQHVGSAGDTLSLDSRLDDLALDSIDLVEVLIDVQEEFDVWFTKDELGTVDSLRDLAVLVERRRTQPTELTA
jgi:acyl carrier protein